MIRSAPSARCCWSSLACRVESCHAGRMCFVSPTAAGWLRMHARVSSRSLNGEGVSRTSSGRRSSSATTNSRGLASPKWGEQLRVGRLSYMRLRILN